MTSTVPSNSEMLLCYLSKHPISKCPDRHPLQFPSIPNGLRLHTLAHLLELPDLLFPRGGQQLLPSCFLLRGCHISRTWG